MKNNKNNKKILEKGKKYFKLLITAIVSGVIIIILLVACSVISYRNYMNDVISHNNFERLNNNVIVLSSMTNNNFNNNFKEMEVLSEFLNIEYNGDEIVISDNSFEILEKIKTEHKYHQIAILNTEGVGYLSNKNQISYSLNNFFINSKGKDEYLSIINNNLLASIKKINGNIPYYILSSIEIDNLSSIMPDISGVYSGDCYSLITDSNGNILCKNNYNGIELINESNFFTFVNNNLSEKQSAITFNDDTPVSISLNVDGDYYYFQYASILNSDLYYLIGISEVHLNSITNNLVDINRRSILILFAVISFFTILTSYFIIKNLRFRDAKEVFRRDELFRIMSAHIDTAFAFFNIDNMEYEFASENFDNIFGIKAEEFKKNPINILPRILGKEKYFEILNFFRKRKEKSYQCDFKYIDPRTNQLIYGKVDFYCVTDLKNVDNYIGIFTDETQDIEYKNMLISSLEKIKNADKQKSNFFSQMSHEIRTPINAIIGMATIAKKEVKKQDNQSLIRSIDQVYIASKSLLYQLNDILDLTKIESGNTKVDNTCFSLFDLIYTINEIYSGLCKSKNIEYISNMSEVTINYVISDQKMISQIINNLLSNAVKFSKENGKVSLRLKQIISDEKNLVLNIIVEDNGIGMSESFLKKLFIPFSQEENKCTTKGSGIGTTICKHLVDLLGGKIEVQSKLNIGTRFSIIIPMMYEQKEYVYKKEEYDFSILKDKKVLVIEDIDINIEVVTMFLEAKEIIVYSVNSGLKGIEEYKKHEEGYFDAILMDIRMPNLDGYETTKLIRDLGRSDYLSIPILAMTADAFTDDIIKTYNAGMNAHITKPIDEDVLYKTLYEQIKKYRKI